VIADYVSVRDGSRCPGVIGVIADQPLDPAAVLVDSYFLPDMLTGDRRWHACPAEAL
jgi:hypothetical protein